MRGEKNKMIAYFLHQISPHDSYKTMLIPTFHIHQGLKLRPPNHHFLGYMLTLSRRRSHSTLYIAHTFRLSVNKNKKIINKIATVRINKKRKSQVNGGRKSLL